MNDQLRRCPFSSLELEGKVTRPFLLLKSLPLLDEVEETFLFTHKQTEDRIVSHISTVKTQVRSERVFERACKALGLVHGVGEVRGYASRTMNGMWVKLPNWLYPVCFNADGTLTFDNYSENPPTVNDIRQVQDGHWGKVSELKKFLREYAKQSVLVSAEEQGLTLLSTQEEGQEVVLELAAY